VDVLQDKGWAGSPGLQGAEMKGGVNLTERPELDFFSKYLSLWVAVCIALGTVIGYLFPRFRRYSRHRDRECVGPVAIVLLIMMYPIMLKISFKEIAKVKNNRKPLWLTLIVNWAIKPFTMALLAWLFMRVLFSSLIPAGLQEEYIAGMILLGLAPCTAMVLVWTSLAKSNLNYALIQVAVNDLVILFLFAPLGNSFWG